MEIRLEWQDGGGSKFVIRLFVNDSVGGVALTHHNDGLKSVVNEAKKLSPIGSESVIKSNVSGISDVRRDLRLKGKKAESLIDWVRWRSVYYLFDLSTHTNGFKIIPDMEGVHFYHQYLILILIRFMLAWQGSLL